MEAPHPSGETAPLHPQVRAEVVGVPKWFMVATMSAVIAGSVSGAVGGVKLYAQSEVMADRLERLEQKTDKIDAMLAAATLDRWTAAQDHSQDASVEARILQRIDRLEARLERVSGDRGDRPR